MKYITKIGLIIALLGSIAALIVGEIYNANFGTWGFVGLIAVIALCLILLSFKPLLTFLKDNFDIEYSKKDGFKITEEKK